MSCWRLTVCAIAARSRSATRSARIRPEDLFEALLLHVAVLTGFCRQFVGDLSRNHGDAVFVTVQQITRLDLHAVDVDRRTHVVDARSTVRHHQSATEVVESAERGD